MFTHGVLLALLPMICTIEVQTSFFYDGVIRPRLNQFISWLLHD
jgi:hypothetical protein